MLCASVTPEGGRPTDFPFCYLANRQHPGDLESSLCGLGRDVTSRTGVGNGNYGWGGEVGWKSGALQRFECHEANSSPGTGGIKLQNWANLTWRKSLTDRLSAWQHQFKDLRTGTQIKSCVFVFKTYFRWLFPRDWTLDLLAVRQYYYNH